MILRNNNLVGGSGPDGGRRDLPEDLKKTFEEGCYLIFMRWTALQLAIINEWGGNDSKDKAKNLFEDVLDWFYNAKDHELSDLQDLLDETIQVDFNVQAEDDSPYMVARSLYNTYNQVANGDTSYVETLRRQFEANGANQVVAESMRNSAQFLGGEEESGSDDDEDTEGDDGSEGMEIDEDEGQGGRQPVVDADGWEVVQRKGR
jgi:pre-rRNA-processing protein TSR2